MTTVAALEMIEISKGFPGVRALEAVSFDCRPGEVHAICGENGAGKSTLMKILGGIYRPDAGTLRIGGRAVAFAHPVDARRAGIGIIHQELSLLPDRSVAENIYLGLEPVRRGMLDRSAMQAGGRKLLERLGSAIPIEARAGDLSVAGQQIVEIAKALALDPAILVMDEPTAALDDTEAGRLLDLVRRLRSQEVALVYVSHRLPEIAAISDRVTVLKDGRMVATDGASAMPAERLVRLMVGRDLAELFPPRATAPPGEVLLEMRGCGNATLSNIDLDVRRGEIVGVAGLEGSGKSDLARAVVGDAPFTRGEMRFEGRSLAPRSARRGIAAGIGLLPDDRKREALTLGQSIRDNAALTLRAFAGALRRPGSGAMADRVLDLHLRALDVRAPRFDGPIRLLSGGNQQKVVIARWLARDPALLIFAEPTRGIDVAAKAAIYRIMRDLAARGRGILMVSSDLPEVVGVSDRIVVLHRGRVAGQCDGGAAEEDVMALAVGHRASGSGRPAEDGPMSAASTALPVRSRRRLPVPLLLFAISTLLYAAVALWTQAPEQLGIGGLVGLLQRMVALGMVALGQTFVILCGSIDLSVGTVISVAAVAASAVMRGSPAMIGPAVLAVVLLSLGIGLVNGLVITRLKVSPLIATLGLGLVLQGVLSANFKDFASSVPTSFQVLAYGALGPLPWSVLAFGAFALIGWWILQRTRFGAHLYAVGGNAAGARLAGIRTDLVTLQVHALCSMMAGLCGLYLASRLGSGAPWIGRDGVYDLESIAVVVIGGTLLSGGRGGVWGTVAGVLLFAVIDAMFNMLGVPAFPKQILRGAIVIAAVAAYAARSKGHVA